MGATARYFMDAGSPWNTPLPADAPVLAASDSYVTALDAMIQAHGWWINQDTFSAPIYHATADTPLVPVALYMSDGVTLISPNVAGTNMQRLAARLQQGVPIPAGATPAAGTDKHMIVVRDDTGEYWDFWAMDFGVRGAGWACSSAGWIPTHRLNPGLFVDAASPYQSRLWGSNATDLPMLAGLILDEELRAGVIPHALQCVINKPKNTAVWPAQQSDGDADGLIPEGSIFRIKRSVDVSAYTADNGQATIELRMLAKAMQDYGLIVNDRGGDGLDLRVEETSDYAFGDFANNMLAHIPTTDFEFIDPSYRPAVAPREPIVADVREYVGMLG